MINYDEIIASLDARYDLDDAPEAEERDERPEDERADDEACERDGWTDEDGRWRETHGGEG